MGIKSSRTKKLRKLEKKKNAIIEEQLQQDQLQEEKEIKLLLTGTGDSGKSTFVKQIQILFKEGFNEDDQKAHKQVIRANLVFHMKALIRAAEELNISLLKENQIIAEEFLDLPSVSKGEIPDDVSIIF
eukprot:Anaeramoba_ignava/c21502_g1_i1.p2 GENE.c21502_g1_i1~~c21502_g1_i1.p2  ORF type:complete len:129 (+),score=51.15 c21502_g1_i1:1567-1953(+)